MKRYVVGSYAIPQEAVDAVKKLQEEGYQKEDITLISSTESRNSISNTTDVEVTTDDAVTGGKPQDIVQGDRTIWGKIKGAFSTDEYDATASTSSDDDPLYSYQKDLANGNIVVMVNGERKETSENALNSNRVTTPLDPDPMFGTATTINTESLTESTKPADVPRSANTNQTADDETIQLKEEQLDVNTREVKTGEVQAKKRVIEETQTVEVPVRHEEIVIQRHKTNDNNSSGDTTKDEEIVIPVTEEQIEVTKHPVVKEEVSINKEAVEDTKQVNETVKKEELNVDTQGDAPIEEINHSNPDNQRL